MSGTASTKRAGIGVLLAGLAAGAVHAQAGPARWPSVEEQERRAQAPAGSALDRLIAANQDFSLLRPEESHDTIPVPPWLRVAWRRAHPDGNYSGADPTGGYPLALKEIAEWLTLHPDLTAGPAKSQPPALESEGATVGVANRSVSGAAGSPRSESDIRVFPGDGSHVIAASNNIGSGGLAEFASSDGGRSWSSSELPLVADDAFHSDPTVEWTSDGTAWSLTLGIAPSGPTDLILRTRLYRSTDWGASWQFDSIFSADQVETDKPQLWVDRAAASPGRDSIYATWHNGAAVYANWRRGGSSGTPLRLSHAETTGTGIGGDIKTNSAGTVFAFWPDTGSRKIFVVRSTNRGLTFTAPQRLASTFDSFDIGVPAQKERRALIYVSGGAFKAPGRDVVVAAWTDLSGATGCTSPAFEPGGNAASACKMRVWFARSLDGGVTWSAKKMLNNQAGKNDQFNQALAVDEATGAISVVYYDTVGDPARQRTNVWYQSSYDDGATFTAPLKVTTAASNEAIEGADQGNQYGDYNGLALLGGVSLPVWTDRRASGPEEIWTARVLDQPPACVPLAPPTRLAATPGSNRVTLSWRGVAGALEYHVYRSTTQGGPYQLAAAVRAPTTTFTQTGLAHGARRYFVVRTFTRCESRDSSEVVGVAN